MGIINTKDLRRIDEATSNSSLSNLRYVITEKPKWKVFKKKEVVPLQPYRPAKGCPCGNDGPCKQKVTPKGVTIHYPQKKKKLGFGSFSYKLPKVQKSFFSRLAWKALTSALPFQTRINANINLSLPLWPINKVTNAFKAVKSMKGNLPSVRSKIKSFKSLRTKKKAPVKKINSADFMFMPFEKKIELDRVIKLPSLSEFLSYKGNNLRISVTTSSFTKFQSVVSVALATGLRSNEDQTVEQCTQRGFKNGRFSFGSGDSTTKMEAKLDDSSPTVVNKVKMIKHKKFPTWRLDQISCDSPFCRNYGSSRCSIVKKPKWKVRELVSNELMSPSSLGILLEGSIVPVPPPPPSASPTTVVNQESVSPLNIM